MALGFTYPRTSSDRDRPVTEFKTHLAAVIRRMADNERDRRRVTMRRSRDITDSVAREIAWREVADMCDNIIVEGE